MGRHEEVSICCSVCKNQSSHIMLKCEELLPITLEFCLPTAIAGHLLQECPRCEYVEKDVSEPLGLDPSFLEREDYYLNGDIGFQNEEERKFIRYAMICKERRDHKNAGWAYLYAANVTDPYYIGNGCTNDRSLRYRNKALDELRQVCFYGMEREAMERTQLSILDTLRRVGRFAEASEYAEELLIVLENYPLFLTFQKKVIRAKSSRTYTVGEMVRLNRRL